MLDPGFQRRVMMETHAVSAERVTEALDWVREVLGPVDAAVANAGVEQTSASIGSLEAIREQVRRGDAKFTCAVEDASLRAREYTLLADAGARGRIEELEANLDAASLSDAHALAALLAQLAVPLRDASSPEKCSASLMSIAEQVVSARVEALAEEADASVAVAQLLGASGDLQNAHAAYYAAVSDAEAAKSSEKKENGRAMQMNAKADQYDLETRELKQKVRASGITADITHDAILAASRETDSIEARQSALDKELAVYQGLPSVGICCAPPEGKSSVC
jgi:hypothetical protein